MVSRFNSFPVLVFLSLLFISCGGGDDGGDESSLAPAQNSAVGAATVGIPSAETSATEDGGEEQVQAESARESREEANPGCTSTADCDAGLVCDCAKACVPEGLLACVEDKNCGSGNYCDLCAGMCYPLKELCEPCGADGECAGSDTKCLSLLQGGQVCGLACLSDVGCPAGFSCTEIESLATGQCVPDSGTCEVLGECEQDTDCTPPYVCNTELVCVEGCLDDGACPSGFVCEAGNCVGACSGDSECPGEKICVEGHCTVEGGCITSADCPEPETYCDLASSLCVAGCQVDSDCKSSGLMCDNGSCVTKGCTANFFCAFGEVCDLSSGACVTPPEPHCATCDPQNDTTCTSAYPGSQCLTFADESGAEKGSFCLIACGDDPSNPCPQGYSCEEVEIEEGTTTPLCLRDCSIPPV